MTSTLAELPQGDLRLLADPIATDLLASTELARLAYVAADGTPRVIPVGWLWDGSAFVVATFAASPKVRALQRDPAVALTIDRAGPPPVALLVRGKAAVRLTAGVPEEYLRMQEKFYGPEPATAAAEAFAATPMAVITITPTWVATMDFQTRLPGALTGAAS
jgi:hypothetical protein